MTPTTTFPKLDENSPRIANAPPNTSVTLKPHQEAIIKACIDLEACIYKEQDKEPYGVIAAPVGCGKTYCILSMCAFDKEESKNNKNNKNKNAQPKWYSFLFKDKSEEEMRKQVVTGATLIVVPSHLYHQWCESIDMFLGQELNVVKFGDYSDVMRLYDKQMKETIENGDLFLVSSLYYQCVATSLTSLKVTFRRLVFDEADSMSNMINYATPATVTWFVSASISSMVNDKGLRIGNGVFHVPYSALAKNTIDVSEDFVKMSFLLPSPTYSEIVCKDPIQNEAVNQIRKRVIYTSDVSKMIELEKALISCDWRTLFKHEGVECYTKPLSEAHVLEQLRVSWVSKLQRCKEMMRDTKQIQDDDPANDEELRLETKIANLAEIDETSPTEFFKMAEALRFCRKAIDEGTKTIVFSTESAAIIDLANLLTSENLEYTDLDGSSGSMASALLDFNRGKIKVLLCHSAMFSCGANLEATQAIVFLHRIPSTIKDQVIGRAQRPGRVGELQVWETVYDTEALFQKKCTKTSDIS
jgi:hypothetical protein